MLLGWQRGAPRREDAVMGRRLFPGRKNPLGSRVGELLRWTEWGKLGLL